jgi:hypothetical protein
MPSFILASMISKVKYKTFFADLLVTHSSDELVRGKNLVFQIFDFVASLRQQFVRNL